MPSPPDPLDGDDGDVPGLWPASIGVIIAILYGTFMVTVLVGYVVGITRPAGFTATAMCSDSNGDATASGQHADISTGSVRADGKWVNVEVTVKSDDAPGLVGVDLVPSDESSETIRARVEGSLDATAYLDEPAAVTGNQEVGRRYVSLPDPRVTAGTTSFKIPQTLLDDGKYEVEFLTADFGSFAGSREKPLDRCPGLGKLLLVPGKTNTAEPPSATETPSSRPPSTSTTKNSTTTTRVSARGAWMEIVDSLPAGTMASNLFEVGDVTVAATGVGYLEAPDDQGSISFWEFDDGKWATVKEATVEGYAGGDVKIVDATGDGNNDVIVSDAGSRSTQTVFARLDDDWVIIPFDGSLSVAGLVVQTEPALSVTSRIRSCVPSCAEGQDAFTSWWYDASAKAFVRVAETATADPDAAVGALLDAWASGDRSTARVVAAPAVVDELFSGSYDPSVFALACTSSGDGTYDCGLGITGEQYGYGLVFVVDPTKAVPVVDSWIADD